MRIWIVHYHKLGTGFAPEKNGFVVTVALELPLRQERISGQRQGNTVERIECPVLGAMLASSTLVDRIKVLRLPALSFSFHLHIGNCL